MRMDRLTSKFQLALADAQSLAVGRDHQFIEPAHVLLALLDQQGGTVRPLLDKAGVNVNWLRSELLGALNRLPKVEGTPGEVHVSNDLGRLLNVTDKLAQQKGDQFVSSELFVLAAVEDKGPVGQALKAAGAVKGALDKAVDELRGGEKVQDANAEEAAAPSTSSPSTSPRAPRPASSTRSSAATTRSAAPSRCCSGAPRTTRC
jgi:ATP-dependent Clp protease ATP-binding subunit ClpB